MIRTLYYDQGINPRGRHNNINTYVPNIKEPQYIRETLTDIKGETDSNTIIVGDLNTPFTPTETLSKQKIIRKHVLNDALDEKDFIDIFRTFH